MFTGLIEGTGKVESVRRIREDLRIRISPGFSTEDCRVGDSISVDGVCLTVIDTAGGTLAMDVSGETLSRSTLSRLKHGDEVNLERAMKLSDRLGGHLVTGHVDGIGKILKKESRQRSWFLRIGIDPRLSRYTIEKGSIAVDGISLTINRCEEGFFEVNVIPQTGSETTLLKKRTGDLVNIETDLIGKYIEKFFSGRRGKPNGNLPSGIDTEWLIKQGFGD